MSVCVALISVAQIVERPARTVLQISTGVESTMKKITQRGKLSA
jgi:hypothetical protein